MIESIPSNGTGDYPHQDLPAPDRQIDITAERCPMTFVRTRLALDRMADGEVLLVRLAGAEPRVNVPRMAATLGHQVIAQIDEAGDVTRIWIRRGTAAP